MRWLLCLLLATGIARADVREISSMQEIVPALESGTLLVFDIDNTLVTPLGYIGSDQWYYYLSTAIARDQPKLSKTQVQEKADAVWTRAQDLVKVRPVEALTPALIRGQQERGIRVMALTARAESDAPATFRQLHDIGVDLDLNSVHAADLHVPGGYWSHGVLFVGEGVDKGKFLVEFLGRIGLKPSRIVFADDKPHHARNVDAALSAAGIPATVFRYGAEDARVRAFNEVMQEAADPAGAALLFHGRLGN